MLSYRVLALRWAWGPSLRFEIATNQRGRSTRRLSSRRKPGPIDTGRWNMGPGFRRGDRRTDANSQQHSPLGMGSIARFRSRPGSLLRQPDELPLHRVERGEVGGGVV